MSLPTSDFHRPTVCAGRYKYALPSSEALARCIAAAPSGATPKSGVMQDANDFSTITLPIETPLRLTNAPSNNGGHVDRANSYHGNNLMKASLNNSGDLASVDSSDTYASCQTHPFLSQGDLTGEMADITCTLAELDVDDLYFSTLDKDRPSTSTDCKLKSQVKKSASGDASLLSLGACAPMEEVMVSFTHSHCVRELIFFSLFNYFPFFQIFLYSFLFFIVFFSFSICFLFIFVRFKCKSSFSFICRKHFNHSKWRQEWIVVAFLVV